MVHLLHVRCLVLYSSNCVPRVYTRYDQYRTKAQLRWGYILELYSNLEVSVKIVRSRLTRLLERFALYSYKFRGELELVAVHR
jgi:hypothetical protein